MTMPHANPPPERLALEEASTADLVREILDEARELVRIEVEIAKSEMRREVVQAKRAAVGFAVALSAAIVVIALLAVALVLALGGTALAALGLAGGFVVVSAVGGVAGYGALPRRPLALTRERISADVKELKEHLA